MQVAISNSNDCVSGCHPSQYKNDFRNNSFTLNNKEIKAAGVPKLTGKAAEISRDVESDFDASSTQREHFLPYKIPASVSESQYLNYHHNAANLWKSSQDTQDQTKKFHSQYRDAFRSYDLPLKSPVENKQSNKYSRDFETPFTAQSTSREHFPSYENPPPIVQPSANAIAQHASHGVVLPENTQDFLLPKSAYTDAYRKYSTDETALPNRREFELPPLLPFESSTTQRNDFQHYPKIAETDSTQKLKMFHKAQNDSHAPLWPQPIQTIDDEAQIQRRYHEEAEQKPFEMTTTSRHDYPGWPVSNYHPEVIDEVLPKETFEFNSTSSHRIDYPKPDTSLNSSVVYGIRNPDIINTNNIIEQNACWDANSRYRESFKPIDLTHPSLAVPIESVDRDKEKFEFVGNTSHRQEFVKHPLQAYQTSFTTTDQHNKHMKADLQNHEDLSSKYDFDCQTTYRKDFERWSLEGNTTKIQDELLDKEQFVFQGESTTHGDYIRHTLPQTKRFVKTRFTEDNNQDESQQKFIPHRFDAESTSRFTYTTPKSTSKIATHQFSKKPNDADDDGRYVRVQRPAFDAVSTQHTDYVKYNTQQKQSDKYASDKEQQLPYNHYDEEMPIDSSLRFDATSTSRSDFCEWKIDDTKHPHEKQNIQRFLNPTAKPYSSYPRPKFDAQTTNHTDFVKLNLPHTIDTSAETKQSQLQHCGIHDGRKGRTVFDGNTTTRVDYTELSKAIESNNSQNVCEFTKTLRPKFDAVSTYHQDYHHSNNI